MAYNIQNLPIGVRSVINYATVRTGDWQTLQLFGVAHV
jgi:hypothetical protein